MKFLSIFLVVILLFSCEKKKEVIRQGSTAFLGDTWKMEYFLDHDSAFVEYRYPNDNKLFYRQSAASQQDMEDSTFDGVFYFRNGNVHAKISKVKNKPDGDWHENFEDGSFRSITYYKKGTITYYEDRWSNGVPHIISAVGKNDSMYYRETYENGGFAQDLSMDSTGSGKCVNYFMNGQKKSEGNVFHKERFGLWKSWDSLGIPLKDSLYGLPKVK